MTQTTKHNHKLINFFCPLCDNQLIHNSNNINVFCSNTDNKCGFVSTINNTDTFNSLIDKLTESKKKLLHNAHQTEKELINIKKQISHINQQINDTKINSLSK